MDVILFVKVIGRNLSPEQWAGSNAGWGKFLSPVDDLPQNLKPNGCRTTSIPKSLSVCLWQPLCFNTSYSPLFHSVYNILCLTNMLHNSEDPTHSPNALFDKTYGKSFWHLCLQLTRLAKKSFATGWWRKFFLNPKGTEKHRVPF